MALPQLKTRNGLFAAIALSTSLIFVGATRSQNVSPNVTFINNTDATLTSIQVSPPNSRDWSENLLDGQVSSSEQINLTIADVRSDCRYDVRADFADGASVEDFDVDFCRNDVYTFSVAALW